MTFIEAAEFILRAAKRPLHYKKITDIAIGHNLLSHVGKTPEVTMSARLAMLSKNESEQSQFVRVKPGVFGLREFSEAVLNANYPENDFEIDLGEIPMNASAHTAEAANEPADLGDAPVANAEGAIDQDDEPLLGSAEDDSEDDATQIGRNGGRRRRRRGRGRGREREEGASAEGGANYTTRETEASADDDDYDRRGYDADSDADVPDNTLVGQSLADAVYLIMSTGPRQATSVARVTEALVRKGRLAGSVEALAPTVAAAIRADISQRKLTVQRPRFRFASRDRLLLVDWSLSREALRFEREVDLFANKQKREVRDIFCRKLEGLPMAAFAELVATWLNAEGVSALRAVRPREPREWQALHLAGCWTLGLSETRVAVVVIRDRRPVSAKVIMEIRGSIHHYAEASSIWLVTTGSFAADAIEEAKVPGAVQCVLFDGAQLAKAMERFGIGIRTYNVVLDFIDHPLMNDTADQRPSMHGSQHGSQRDRGRQRFNQGGQHQGGQGRHRSDQGGYGSQGERHAQAGRNDQPSEPSAPTATQDAVGDDVERQNDTDALRAEPFEADNSSWIGDSDHPTPDYAVEGGDDTSAVER